VFADPEVRALVTERFVPVAFDVWYLERATSEAGRFFQAAVRQRGVPPGKSTQGFYVVDARGALLEAWNHRGSERLLERMRRALAREAPEAAPEIEPAAAREDRFARRAPEGAAVVDVFSRIVRADWPPDESPHAKAFREATGRDRLWVLREEVASLAKGEMPESLLRRVARFHLVDDTRGEPPLWDASEIVSARAAATPRAGGHDLEGEVVLATASGDRRYRARLRGRVEAKDGRLVRFDLLALGPFAGEGRYTKGAPPGEFTLAVALRLSPPDDPGRVVPPQGARDLAGYLGT
jgi:hypothetical protein